MEESPEAETAAEEAAEDAVPAIPPAEAPAGVKNAASEDFLQEIIKSRDRQKLLLYVTDNGQKRLAKNSDLLTSYDRSGKIVNVSPSDKRLILEGDFRDIRL